MWNHGMFVAVFCILLIRTVFANRKILASRGSRAAYICLTGLTLYLLTAYAFGLKPPSFPGWLVDRTIPVFTKFTKG
ncbi:hypothetical protein [Paenibacillus contaminans]|uniref:Uncharacterized protein n=1 Tax=Paenibacillus contaminans TaxID=450362 RepID=A0A329MFA9_9BACL|nr:hypothetical protein [Paenibacillus contaminans]RAV18590.1 hypothetical protein DQG23_25140 [Paenibacillus contaminans]